MTHQRFRESKIQVEMLSPNPTDQLFQAVMQGNVIKWQVLGRKAQEQVRQLSKNKHFDCDSFSQKSRDFQYLCELVTKYGYAVMQAFLQCSIRK